MSLKKKTLSGLYWSGYSQVGKQLSQVIISAILARLLAPSDFGLLALTTVFTGFAMIFGDMGVSYALIQKQDVEDKHWSSAFWLNIFLGCFLSIFFIVFAGIIARFLNCPESKALLQVMSLNFVLAAFTIIPQAMLMKSMDFKHLMFRDIVSTVLAGVIGIMAALWGGGVWSLVYQLLSFTIVNNLLLWSFCRWRPKLFFSWEHLKSIFNFSLNMTGFQVINYLSRNTDQLLIGKFLGPGLLGYYSLAYKLMLMPLQNISWTISRVAFPAFSQIQHDRVKLLENYAKMVRAISLMTFPLMVFVFIIAPELVLVIYGEKWGVSADLLRILCLCGMAQSVTTTVGTVYQSIGKIDIQLRMSIANTVLVVVAIMLGIKHGVYGVALAYSLFAVMWGFFSMYVVSRILNFNFPKFLWANFRESFLIAIVLLLIAVAIKKVLPGGVMLNLATLSIVALTTYWVCLFLFKLVVLRGRRLIVTVFD
jgi:O-antigen/teichoic acid export membrane protein